MLDNSEVITKLNVLRLNLDLIKEVISYSAGYQPETMELCSQSEFEIGLGVLAHKMCEGRKTVHRSLVCCEHYLPRDLDILKLFW